jgi:hypothetical protein
MTVDDSGPGAVLGTADRSANRAGPGDRVATASFIVAREAPGQGVGMALCEYVVHRAPRGFAEIHYRGQ